MSDETPSGSGASGSAAAAEAPQAGIAGGAGSHAVLRRSRLGLWAFVLSLLGVSVLPVIGSVLGFVLGRLAIRKADAAPIVGGRGLAVAAVTISVVTLAIIAVSIAAYALVVAFLDV